MKKFVVLPCILLMAAIAVAQTVTDIPAVSEAPAVAAPAVAVLPASSAVPAGTSLMVRLETTLATFSNKVGDPFRGRISQPVMANGMVMIPAGATVEGRVTKVSEPRRISGKPVIGILPEAVIMPSGERFFLDATLVDTNLGRGTDVNEEGQFKGSGRPERNDKLEIGGGTAGGMLIGGLIGGGPGVVVGGLVGAGSTTVHWLSKTRSAVLPAGTELTLELNRPLTMSSVGVGSGSR